MKKETTAHSIFPIIGFATLFLIVIYVLFGDFNSEVGRVKQDGLSDGQHLGFFSAVDARSLVVGFDDVVWLTGQEAESAVTGAGQCSGENRDECLPKAYFIENISPKDQLVSVDPNVLVFMQTLRSGESGDIADKQISLEQFGELVNNPALHWQKLPFAITINGGTIERIQEVYIP